MTDAFDVLKEFSLAFSWFDEEREILGKPARPLSMGSRHAIDLMGLRVLRRDPEYATEAEEMGELYAYAWLHTAPLGDVCRGLRDGAWRAALTTDPPTQEERAEILGPWREKRMELAATAAAVDYRVVPRPKSAKAKDEGPRTPGWVMEPLVVAYRLRLLMRDTGAGREEALWHFPYAQAMQICLAAQRWEDQWTAPKGDGVKAESFEAFDLEGDEETGG